MNEKRRAIHFSRGQRAVTGKSDARSLQIITAHRFLAAATSPVICRFTATGAAIGGLHAS